MVLRDGEEPSGVSLFDWRRLPAASLAAIKRHPNHVQSLHMESCKVPSMMILANMASGEKAT